MVNRPRPFLSGKERRINRSTHVLVFALGFSLTLACGDDDGDGESLESLCEKGCAISASLACPNDNPSTCLSECVASADVIPEACRAQANIALECVVNRPASDWECDPEGGAIVKDGVCTEESDPLGACLFGSAEDAMCPFEDDDECDDPTGTDLCPPGTDRADCAQATP